MQLCAAKRAGLIEGVVYSTWLGEVDRYDNLRETLERCGVILVETPDPAGSQFPILGTGNIVRQKVSLSWALDLVPDDSFIFKTRPDQPITTTQRIAELFQSFNKMNFLVTDIEKPVIRYRIWSGRRHPTIPFFIDDRNFFTHASVAKKMCAIRGEIYLLMNRSNNIAEINWYATLFWDDIPLVRRMLCINWLKLHSDGQDASYHEVLKEADIYWLSQAAYKSILDRYFYLGFDGFSVDDYGFLGEDSYRRWELPATKAEIINASSEIENDPRHEAARSLLLSVGGACYHGKLLHALPLLDKYTDDTSGFGNIKIARRISIPNPDEVSAEISTVDLRNTVSLLDRPTDFDENYLERIELEIKIPATSAPTTFIPVVVRINDLNDRALVLNPQRQIALGYRWFHERSPLWVEFPRIPVRSYMRPLTEVAFQVLSPPVLGSCVLQVDLLIDGEFWFGRPAQSNIKIRRE
jgi:hypothetical protein